LFSTGSFLLVDRRVAECFGRFQEQNRITFALVAWTGFEQATVDYERAGRVAGRSGWTFRRSLKATYDAVIGFSPLPARLMTRLGLLVFLFSVPLSLYVLHSYWTREVLPGWSSLMLVLSVLFGLQFLLMGLMGEYLFRIYLEVVQRPLYFVAAETPDVVREAADGEPDDG
jgi:dolichol-phosphate mannosyltransferase